MLVKCTECGDEFDKLPSQIKKSKTGNHFCSKSCSAKYNNSYRSRKDRRPDFTCNNCGIISKSTHKNQKYCSNVCHKEYQSKSYRLELESGANLTHGKCKSYWLQDAHKCSCCGLHEWNGLPIPLELDHINGDGTDNTLDNTRLLCPNCHAQTDNYKSKNKDNPLGKNFRNSRYTKALK